jgi:hypothetical protein
LSKREKSPIIKKGKSENETKNMDISDFLSFKGKLLKTTKKGTKQLVITII